MVGKYNPLFVSKTERFSLCSRDHPQKPLVNGGISQNLKFLLVPDSINDFNIYLLYDPPAPKWSWVSSGECSSSRMYQNLQTSWDHWHILCPWRGRWWHLMTTVYVSETHPCCCVKLWIAHFLSCLAFQCDCTWMHLFFRRGMCTF